MTGLLGIGLGYPGQPHVLTRYMAASGDEKIRQTQVIAMVWGVLVFFGAGYLGLAGRLLMPELAAGTVTLNVVCQRVLPSAAEP